MNILWIQFNIDKHETPRTQGRLRGFLRVDSCRCTGGMPPSLKQSSAWLAEFLSKTSCLLSDIAMATQKWRETCLPLVDRFAQVDTKIWAYIKDFVLLDEYASRDRQGVRYSAVDRRYRPVFSTEFLPSSRYNSARKEFAENDKVMPPLNDDRRHVAVESHLIPRIRQRRASF